MKPTFRNYRRQLRDIRLTPREKDMLRSQLTAFMASHPRVPERSHSTLSVFLYQRSFTVGALILMIVLSSTGVSFAAEGALPGSLLYPLKTNVLEPLRTTVTLSSEAKLHWEVEKAERRLKEAERLIEKDAFDTERSAMLAGQLQAHATVIAQNIDTLRANEDLAGAADATSAFTAVLRTHQEILTKLADTKEQQRTEPSPFFAKIEEHSQDLEDEEDSLAEEAARKSNSGSGTAALALRKSAEESVSNLRKLYDSRSNALSGGTKTQINDFIRQIETLIEQGSSALDNDRAGDAFLLFQEAHRKSQEAKLLLNAQKRSKNNATIRIKERPATTETTTDDLIFTIIESSSEDTDSDDPRDTSKDQLDERERSDRKESDSKNDRNRRLKDLLPKDARLDDLELDFEDTKDQEDDD